MYLYCFRRDIIIKMLSAKNKISLHQICCGRRVSLLMKLLLWAALAILFLSLVNTKKIGIRLKSFVAPFSEKVYYVGQRDTNDRLAYNATIRHYALDSQDSSVTKYFLYPPNNEIGYTISYMEIVDRMKNSGQVCIMEGGIGFRYVELRATAHRPVGMNYFFKVYTTESVDALNNLSTITTTPIATSTIAYKI